MIASICGFGSYPTAYAKPVEVKSNKIKKRELDDADIYAGYYGSFINVYDGFLTESLIKHSNYRSVFNLNDPRPLELFGSTEEVKRKKKKSGDSLPTSIKGLVDYLNGLRDMDVYYLNPSHADSTAKLANIKDKIQQAMGGDTNALIELIGSGIFAKAGEKVNISAKPISESSIYRERKFDVADVRSEPTKKPQEGEELEVVQEEAPDAVSYLIASRQDCNRKCFHGW